MTFDYKKEYKEFYMPKGTPSIVTVPKINYIAVRGSGNPNDADGEYKQAIGLLYGIAFTILSGSLLFACQILLSGKISTGLSGKLRQRKNRIFLRLSSFSMMKDYVYNACISDRMMMSLLR